MNVIFIATLSVYGLYLTAETISQFSGNRFVIPFFKLRTETKKTALIFPWVWWTLHTVCFLTVLRNIRWLESGLPNTLTTRAILTAAFLFSFFFGLYGNRLAKKMGKSGQAIGALSVILSPVYAFLLTDLPWRGSFELPALDNRFLPLNFLIMTLFLLIFILLLPRIAYGIYALFSLSAVFGIVNAEVVMMRFNPFAPVDVLSIRTAANVAGGYTLVFTPAVALTFLLLGCGIAFSGSFLSAIPKKPLTKKKYAAKICGAAAVLFMLCIWVKAVSFFDAYHIRYNEASAFETYADAGFPLVFAALSHELSPEKPDGYSEKNAQSYLTEDAPNIAPATIKNLSEFANKNPVVLTIMNESYTDFGMVADFTCSDTYQAFLHSLKDEEGILEYGAAYTSTFGGGTYKSEFEYLTGYSMITIPGKIPYMMFDFTDIPCIVKSFGESGHRTVASHPYFSTSWKRDFVYTGMRFNAFLTIDDFHTEDDPTFTGRLSDAVDYQRLIEEIKNTDEPLFLFNVTMQNHGGYAKADAPNVAVEVDDAYNEYEDMQVFEGEMKRSDDALRELFAELKTLDRPVLLTFFGDHQPGLNSECEDKLFESRRDTAANEAAFSQRSFVTPYFIWANYDLEYDTFIKQKSADVDVPQMISLNYLGAMTRYYAGATLSEDDKYLIGLRRDIPVLNANGLYTDVTGWVDVNDFAETLTPELLERLYRYDCIAYAGIYE